MPLIQGQIFTGLRDNFDGIFSQLAKFVVAIVTHLAPLLAETWSLLLPVVAFLTFVLQNGSIVVGMIESSIFCCC